MYSSLVAKEGRTGSVSTPEFAWRGVRGGWIWVRAENPVQGELMVGANRAMNSLFEKSMVRLLWM